MQEKENEIGAPSMYQTTRVWHEGKDREIWSDIYTEYVQKMKNSNEYLYLIDYLKEHYEAPLKK
jgi:hypothetical protein